MHVCIYVSLIYNKYLCDWLSQQFERTIRFVRLNKKYSTELWRKAPAEESLGEVDEYVIQEEDAGELELML